MQDMFDRIWLVKASRELRLKRMLLRDTISEEYAKRIGKPSTDKIRMKYATDVIERTAGTKTSCITECMNSITAYI